MLAIEPAPLGPAHGRPRPAARRGLARGRGRGGRRGGALPGPPHLRQQRDPRGGGLAAHRARPRGGGDWPAHPGPRPLVRRRADGRGGGAREVPRADGRRRLAAEGSGAAAVGLGRPGAPAGVPGAAGFGEHGRVHADGPARVSRRPLCAQLSGLRSGDGQRLAAAGDAGAAGAPGPRRRAHGDPRRRPAGGPGRADRAGGSGPARVDRRGRGRFGRGLCVQPDRRRSRRGGGERDDQARDRSHLLG